MTEQAHVQEQVQVPIPSRLPQSRIKTYREEQLALDDTCPICGEQIKIGKDVLDHSHSTGHIRHVLHRACNSILGRVENNYKRFGVSLEQLSAISPRIYEYITKDYTNNPIHHTYKNKKKKK